jgi:hypothetical protein
MEDLGMLAGKHKKIFRKREVSLTGWVFRNNLWQK